jgi:hypothetical protein
MHRIVAPQPDEPVRSDVILENPGIGGVDRRIHQCLSRLAWRTVEGNVRRRNSVLCDDPPCAVTG